MDKKDKENTVDFLKNGGYIKINEDDLDVFLEEMSSILREHGFKIPDVINKSSFSGKYLIRFSILTREVDILNFTEASIESICPTDTKICIVEWYYIFKGIFSDFKKEEGKMLKILELYEEKKTKEIEGKYDKQLEEVEANDPVKIIIKDAEHTIKQILDTENLRVIINADICEFTKETMNERKKIIDIIRKEKQNLSTQIAEIKALLELAPNYEEKVKILRDYGIMDKKKNIIL